jgi:hypothetical protein
VARGLSLSVAWFHAAARALLFHSEDTRMPDPGHGINNGNFIGEMLAAWIITLLTVAIGCCRSRFMNPVRTIAGCHGGTSHPLPMRQSGPMTYRSDAGQI